MPAAAGPAALLSAVLAYGRRALAYAGSVGVGVVGAVAIAATMSLIRGSATGIGP